MRDMFIPYWPSLFGKAPFFLVVSSFFRILVLLRFRVRDEVKV